MQYKSQIIGKHGFYAKMVADSVTNEGLTVSSLEIRYPRFILPELNTHRAFEKSTSSSRAIPINKMMEQVLCDPARPVRWHSDQPGMQGAGDGAPKPAFIAAWDKGAEGAVDTARNLRDLGLHKQIANRPLDNYAFVTTILTGTDWSNFFHLRTHSSAQPEIQYLANLMASCFEDSTPDKLAPGQWHLPYADINDFKFGSGTGSLYDWDTALQCSAARCARVSYNNHAGDAPSIENDLQLFSQLAVRPCEVKGVVIEKDAPEHRGPLGHQATPFAPSLLNPTQQENVLSGIHWPQGATHLSRQHVMCSGNLRGWAQYRHWLGDD